MDVRGPRPPALGGHGGPHPVCGHTKGTLPGIRPLSPLQGSNIFAPRKTDPLVNPPVCAHTPSHLEAQLCQLGLHTPICGKIHFHSQVLSNFNAKLNSIARFFLEPPSPFHGQVGFRQTSPQRSKHTMGYHGLRPRYPIVSPLPIGVGSGADLFFSLPVFLMEILKLILFYPKNIPLTLLYLQSYTVHKNIITFS